MALTRITSEQVVFKQDAAGSVARKLTDVLSDTLNVKDFGAVGDGVANDTAAIQAALAYMASTGRNVLVTPGVYLSDPLTINVQAYTLQAAFTGTDRERCVIKRRTTGAGAFVTVGAASGTSFQAGFQFSNIQIDGGSNTNGDAFVAYDLVRSTFDNCTFRGGVVACHLFGGISLTFKDCLFEAAQLGLRIEKFTSAAGGGWPNLIRIRGGEIVDNVVGGIYFDHGRMLLLDGVDVEGNGTTLGVSTGGIYVGPNTGQEVAANDTISIGLVVSNCWFEGNRGVAEVNMDSGQNIISESNFFSTAAQVTNDIQVSGGKYVLRNLNMSFTKTQNVLENSGTAAGNVIDSVAAANISYSAAKTTVINGDSINMQLGRVPSVMNRTLPLIQLGSDTTSVNPNISFQTSFKSGTTPLVFTQVQNNSTATLDSPAIYNVTNSGFSLRKNTHNGTVVTTENYSVSWIAIGEAP